MRLSTLFTTLALASSAYAAAPDGSLLDLVKLDDLKGGAFEGRLDNYDNLGVSVTSIGDYNGDGIPDIAVGEPYDDDLGFQSGAVWLVFLETDGTAKQIQKVHPPTGPWDYFGEDVVNLGDLDGNGVPDLGVGTRISEYALVLLMSPDGSVLSYNPIDGSSYTPTDSEFGMGIGAADLNGDGRRELIVGAPEDGKGSLHIFSLDAGGAVVASQEISELTGGFSGELDTAAQFGASVTVARDVDGDGTPDLAVGSPGDDDGLNDAGAVWILFMRPDGTVRDSQKISSLQGNFEAPLSLTQAFGTDVASLGDFDGVNTPDLVVTSPEYGGAVWQLFLKPDGTVRSHLTRTGADLGIDPLESFGASVAAPGDLDGDGVMEIVAGASANNGAGSRRGGLYVLFPPPAIRAGRTPYGCDTNPADSLVPTSAPTIGSTLTFQMHNPLGTQAHEETQALLVASLTGAGECGVPIQGWHMDATQDSGELLVLPPFDLVVLDAGGWFGQPVTVGLPIPNDPCLMGTIGYVQGAMIDFSDDAIVPVGLTRAWEVRLGT